MHLSEKYYIFYLLEQRRPQKHIQPEKNKKDIAGCQSGSFAISLCIGQNWRNFSYYFFSILKLPIFILPGCLLLKDNAADFGPDNPTLNS